MEVLGLCYDALRPQRGPYVPFVLRIRCDYIIVAALFSFMHVYRRGERYGENEFYSNQSEEDGVTTDMEVLVPHQFPGSRASKILETLDDLIFR